MASSSSFAFKETQKQHVFASTQKGVFSAWNNKCSLVHFELILDRHILGTPETHIKFCKKA